MEELTYCFLKRLSLVLQVAQAVLLHVPEHSTPPLSSTYIILRICWMAVVLNML